MAPRLQLDVLVATHNRAAQLDRCVRSILAAAPSPFLDVHTTIICNACNDGSHELVRTLQAAFPGRISLIVERRRGKSKALNAGIAATSGHLVGMIDDDETVDPRWVLVAGAAFQDETLDFAGGPYLPIWASPPPDWLPNDYLAVLGAVDNGTISRPYDGEFEGMLKGGNAIIRRVTLQRVGPFAEHLGPGSFARLFSCEDEDMYLRLLEHGARGQYLPDLVIYHYIANSRLTREHYRKWCFWRGVSQGLMDRRHPLPVTYLAGVPRFLWGRAARALVRLAATPGRRPAHETFGDELSMWDVTGYFYGRHIYTLARFSPIKSRRRGDSTAFFANQRAPAETSKAELAACSSESRQ